MRLAVDTNVLFSFFKKESTTRKLIASVELFELCTLKSRIEELKRYKEVICKKAGITQREFNKSLKELKIFVEIIDDEKVKEFGKEALKISPDREDAPLFALALALNCEIWSNDKRLKNQNRIKVLSTSEIIKILKNFGIEV